MCIRDSASPGLKHVRRSIKLTNERIHSQLNAMVNSSAVSNKLQDNLITMRNGRYCLPVKAEYRSQIQGMIHEDVYKRQRIQCFSSLASTVGKFGISRMWSWIISVPATI